MTNGCSNTRTSRNLTYRQNESSINIISQAVSNNSTLTLSGNTNTGSGSGSGTGTGTGGGGTTDNITATSGDFVRLSSNTLFVDTIKKKTATNTQILINDNLGISDTTTGIPNFNFKFNKDANFYSNSILFDAPITKFRDNVMNINCQVKNNINYSFQELLSYDSLLSGFIFPNINETDSNQINNNSMLIVPANYYLNYDQIQKKIGFNKYIGNYHFNDVLANNVRFIKTDYNFTNDSTNNKTLLNFNNDSELNTINNLNNLLNIEAKNIALGNGDLVLLNGVSFNPNDVNNTPQGKSFNFKFSDKDTPNGLNVFKISKTKVTINLPEVELNNNIICDNIDTTKPKIQYKNSDDFFISRKNNDTTSLDFIKFHRNIDGTGIITFLQPAVIQGGSQGISLIGPVLDFSGNGEVYFQDNLNFNSNNIPIVTFNKDFINIKPELRFVGPNVFQNIKFYPNELRFVDSLENRFLSLDVSNNFVKIHKTLDLSSNGLIQFGPTLSLKTGNLIPFVIKPNSVDISCNTLNFKQDLNSIRFNTNLSIIDTVIDNNTNKYITFDGTLKNIILFKPLNFSGDGDINFQNSINFNTFSGSTLFRIYQDTSLNTYFDTSANLQFLNRNSIIKFPDNGSLSFQDVFGFSYININSINKTIDFINPIRLTGAGQINVTDSLKIVNNSNINLAVFSLSQLQIRGNLVFETSGFIQVSTGNLTFKSGTSDLMILDATLQKVVLLKPLQLDGGGYIYFTDKINFVKSSNLNNILVSVTDTGLETTGNFIYKTPNSSLQFTSIFDITDTSNNSFVTFNTINKTISLNYPILNLNLSTIKFNPNLTIQDNNNNVFMFFDSINTSVNINKILDLSGNGIIKFGNNIIFNNGTNNILELSSTSIDTSANLSFTQANSKLTFNTNFNVSNGANNVLNIKSTSIDTSANITFTQTNSKLIFNTNLNVSNGANNVLNIKSTSIDTSANITFTQTNSKLIFNTNLNVNDGTNDIINIKPTSIDSSANITFLNNNPQVIYNQNLILKNTVTTEQSADPIIKYNIISTNINSFEKKYLTKTKITNGTGVVQYTFKNIIDSIGEQITFNGKVISRDSFNNSASFIIQGYTRYVSSSDKNNLNFYLNTLYSTNSNWKINSFYINNTDLIMEVQSNQTTTTNWVISIESISV